VVRPMLSDQSGILRSGRATVSVIQISEQNYHNAIGGVAVVGPRREPWSDGYAAA
jgi:hypothetical protein